MRGLRRGVGVAAVLAVLVAAAPAAFAQPAPVELKPRLELKLAKRLDGSGARRAALSGSIDRAAPADGVEAPVLVGGSIWLPRGVKLNGDKYPICIRRLIGIPGPSECPDAILGEWPKGARAAVVGPFRNADYVFINTGVESVLAYMTIYEPAFVREPMLIRVLKPGRRRWSYRLTFRIPEVLRVIAGVPVALEGFPLHLDGIHRAPGYVTFDRRCPKRGYLAYRASLTFLDNDNTSSEFARRGRMRCGRAQPGRGPTQ